MSKGHVWRCRVHRTLLPVLLVIGAGCVTVEEARQADALCELGTSYLNEGSTEDAIRELERAKSLNPRDADIRHALGMAFFAKELFPKAEKELLAAIRLDPDLTEAKLNLAALYIAMERYEEALEYLQQVVADYRYRSPARAYNNMGYVYLQLGRYDQAEEALRQALRIAPRFCQAQYNLSLVYEAENRLEDARRHREEAVSLCPDDLRYRLALGMLQVRLDRRVEAIDNFKRVVEADPTGEMGDAAREQLEALQ